MIQTTVIGWARVEVTDSITGHVDTKEYTLMSNEIGIPFDTPESNNKAEVGVTLGGTYNMGNFNMARVQVNITVPCPVGQVEEAYQFCQSFAESKVAQYHQQLFSPYNPQ
jgi:hypothetical protein